MDDVIGALRAAGERALPPEPFDLDSVLRRGEVRGRRRRSVEAVAAAAIAVAGIAVTVAWPDRPVETAVSDAGTPAEELALLAAPRQLDDRLPAVLAGAEDVADLVDSTIRAVATTQDAEFWAAVGPGDEVCLVMFLPGTDWTAAQSCATPSDFAASGIQLSVRGPAGRVEAWLLSDGYEPSPADSESWTFVTPNLAVRPAP